jgi:hypothetical protein
MAGAKRLGREMTQNTERDGRCIAAFVAGGFFYLAGTIFVVLALCPRQGAPLYLGAMLFFVGSIWVVIGAKFKKEAEQR